MKEIRFIAMMRSGQHAIINWLLSQLPKPYQFVNDPLHPTNEHLYKTRLISPEDLYLVYNIEDRFILPGIEECESFLYDHSAEREGEIFNVLILRDPFNMFASRYARQTGRKNLATGEKQSEEIKSGRWSPLGGWTTKKAIECWKNHAQEIHSPTEINMIIQFNEWVQSEEYRQSISESLGLDFNDSEITKRAAVQGEGSSFEGLKDNKNDKVLTRYKKYKYDKYFNSLFDQEVKDMCQEIFGWTIS